MSTAASAKTGAFNPKVVLGLILFGAIAFLATLYFIGSGQTGGNANNGSAHAAGKGLNGFAAMAAHLEEEGHEVSLSRSRGSFDDYGLLILTPPAFADAEDIRQIIRDRAYVGPTLIILPKWQAVSSQTLPGSDLKEGWVHLFDTAMPEWVTDLEAPYALEVDENGSFENPLFTADGGSATSQPDNMRWSGLDYSGVLPTSSAFSSTRNTMIGLVETSDDAILVGYVDDGGYYPDLDAWAGVENDEPEYPDYRSPVVFMVDPDLANNYGYAERSAAEMTHLLVDILTEDGDLPVIFDLTLNGLGSQQNLLTLAISPPFLAATLCLIIALLVIGWRAFRRFGPPVTEGRAIAFGKARLIKNSASFIQRSKRLHLLTGPYADMIEGRIAKALGLRKADAEAIDAALARRVPEAPQFSASAARLRQATRPRDMLSAAAALKSIERMINK